MLEILNELRTCEDVRSLGARGIGEGPRLDYKVDLRLTKGGKKELAKDVSALARVPALEDGVSLLQEVEARRGLGANDPGDAATVEGEARPPYRAERRDRGGSRI